MRRWMMDKYKWRVGVRRNIKKDLTVFSLSGAVKTHETCIMHYNEHKRWIKKIKHNKY